ncbi:hypothetical protein, variant 1 [Aphanomyces astaci]|uniref:EF-hand domain-containing protein n=1 Tax=Aphanomyces astaci TaxID=112090 RepID=W4FRE6_APHAT|nr:hypothetical protein, variant 1 [Aphanomyces astaci]ETV70042.1 hypothetical protein, variant 1 [Aphanomyces astaci]|eukprot:XP_009840485.1 hypothetical protein, variant 1 [Aphanomyces astaci]
MMSTTSGVPVVASDRVSLEEAIKGLQVAIEKYQVLYKLSKLYLHFKDVNPVEVRLHEAACFVSMASIKRLLAEATTPPQSGKQVAYIAEADHHLNSAKAIYSDLTLHEPSQLECKRGLANILQEGGSLRYVQEKLGETQSMWAEACAVYEDIGDAPAVAALRKKMDALRLAHEVEAYTQTLLERKGENRERDAILKAFMKFDKDNSGEMDACEFAALSMELGTFPALSVDEIQEAFVQLDSSADNKISFAEFWQWWSTDEIQAFAAKQKAR